MESEAIGHSSLLEEGSSHKAANKVSPQGHRWFKHQSLRGLPQKSNGSVMENPIQDFLRSSAYDVDAPYFVRKDVMATYVKSCAGYCVITYLLVRLANLCWLHASSLCLTHHFNTLNVRVWVIAIWTTFYFIKTVTCCIAIILSS